MAMKSESRLSKVAEFALDIFWRLLSIFAILGMIFGTTHHQYSIVLLGFITAFISLLPKQYIKKHFGSFGEKSRMPMALILFSVLIYLAGSIKP